MSESEPYIPLDQCVERTIYELASRNLRVGVFVAAERGFIGIREKFGSQYLFTEYHWDTGAPCGTAHPLRAVSTLDDPRIRLWEHYPSARCRYCGDSVMYVPDLDARGEPVVPRYGKWRSEHGKSCNDPSCDPTPYAETYTPLFDVLAGVHHSLWPDEPKPRIR